MSDGERLGRDLSWLQTAMDHASNYNTEHKKTYESAEEVGKFFDIMFHRYLKMCTEIF